jgi:YD repeat-containing protein
VAFAWDGLSRLTGETRGGRTIAYGYDAAGDRTGITWPDASPNNLSATYAFDRLQRVTSIG